MKRLFVLAPLLLAGSMALVACGGDDDDATTDDAAEEEAEPAGAAAVEALDFEFVPVDVEVQAGESVNWVNSGDTVHTVTAEDDSFDSGDLQAGDEFSQSFDEPGTYNYICIYHAPQMAGTITVVE